MMMSIDALIAKLLQYGWRVTRLVVGNPSGVKKKNSVN